MPSAADPSTNNIDKEVAAKATPPPSFLSNYALESFNNEQAMLSIAVVLICGSDGSRRACQALLDCGSQANFVTKKFVEVLGLETRPSSVHPLDLRHQRHGNLDQSRGIKLQSRLNSYTAAVKFIVTDRITGKIPTFSLGREKIYLSENKFKLLRNIRLADPHIVGY